LGEFDIAGAKATTTGRSQQSGRHQRGYDAMTTSPAAKWQPQAGDVGQTTFPPRTAKPNTGRSILALKVLPPTLSSQALEHS